MTDHFGQRATARCAKWLQLGATTMIFYSIWQSANGHVYGFYTYVLPEQIGRENYFSCDKSWWLIPGTFDLNA